MPPQTLVDAFGRVLSALEDGKKHTRSVITEQQTDAFQNLCQQLGASAAATPDALLHIEQLLQLKEVLAANPSCFQATLAAHAILAVLEPQYHMKVVGDLNRPWSRVAVTSQLAALSGLAPALLRCLRKWPNSRRFVTVCAAALWSFCALPMTDCHVPFDELRAAPADTAAALLCALSDDEQAMQTTANNNLMSLLTMLMRESGEQDGRRVAALCAASPAALHAAVDMLLLHTSPRAAEAALAFNDAYSEIQTGTIDLASNFLDEVAMLTSPTDVPPARPLAATPGLVRAVAAVLSCKQASDAALGMCLRLLVALITTHQAASALSSREQESLRRALGGAVRCLNHASPKVWWQAAQGVVDVLSMPPRDPRVRSMLLQLPLFPALVAALRRGKSSGGGGDGDSSAYIKITAARATLAAAAISLALACGESAPAPEAASTLGRLLASAPDALESVAQQVTAAAAAVAERGAPGSEAQRDAVLVIYNAAVLLSWPLDSAEGEVLLRACRATGLPQALGAAADALLQLPELADGRLWKAVAAGAEQRAFVASQACSGALGSLAALLLPDAGTPDEARGACEAVATACPALVGRLEGCLTVALQDAVAERPQPEEGVGQGQLSEEGQQQAVVRLGGSEPGGLLANTLKSCSQVLNQLKGTRLALSAGAGAS